MSSLIIYKVSDGPKAKITQTEYTTVGNRSSLLQGRILTLTGKIRTDSGKLISFLWTDDRGHMWETYHNDDSNETPTLTGKYVRPVKKRQGQIVLDFDRTRNAAPIRIFKIEKA